MAKTKPPIPIRALRTQAKIKGAKAQLTSPQTVRQIERRFKVMAMRRQGYTLEDIADTLKCAVETVRTDLAEVLSRTASKMLETTEEMREQELDRYRSLLKFHQPLAEAGNLASAGLVITISREIRKLMAVDKPEEKREQESGIRVYVGINMEDV